MAGVALSDVKAWGAGFEAVGTALGATNAQKGAAFKSPDGTTWAAASNEPFKDSTLAAVATVHAGLVALGAGHCSLECGGFQSWLSTDGTTWIGPAKASAPGDDARGIGLVEEGSTIVAVATELQDPSTNKNRGRVYLSTDAEAWMDPLTADALAQDIPTGIATDGTSLVAVGSTISSGANHNGGAWRSTDGHAWSAATKDGSFDGANGGAAWTSTDGNSWRTSGTIQGSEGAKFVAVAIGSTASIIVGGPMGSSAGMVWVGPLP